MSQLSIDTNHPLYSIEQVNHMGSNYVTKKMFFPFSFLYYSPAQLYLHSSTLSSKYNHRPPRPVWVNGVVVRYHRGIGVPDHRCGTLQDDVESIAGYHDHRRYGEVLLACREVWQSLRECLNINSTTVSINNYSELAQNPMVHLNHVKPIHKSQ